MQDVLTSIPLPVYNPLIDLKLPAYYRLSALPNRSSGTQSFIVYVIDKCAL